MCWAGARSCTWQCDGNVLDREVLVAARRCGSSIEELEGVGSHCSDLGSGEVTFKRFHGHPKLKPRDFGFKMNLKSCDIGIVYFKLICAALS
jgi:hypothetical protein